MIKYPLNPVPYLVPGSTNDTIPKPTWTHICRHHNLDSELTNSPHLRPETRGHVTRVAGLLRVTRDGAARGLPRPGVTSVPVSVDGRMLVLLGRVECSQQLE